MWRRTCVVCTVDMRPVWVSQRLRLPSVSPMITRWPHAAIAVATPSDELDISPHDGRFGLVSVTCRTTPAAVASFARTSHRLCGLQKMLVPL